MPTAQSGMPPSSQFKVCAHHEYTSLPSSAILSASIIFNPLRRRDHVGTNTPGSHPWFTSEQEGRGQVHCSGVGRDTTGSQEQGYGAEGGGSSQAHIRMLRIVEISRKICLITVVRVSSR